MEQIDILNLLKIAAEAGDAVMEVYNTSFTYKHKEDCSPLTLADKRSNEIITQRLQEAYPDIPIISEESKSIPYETRSRWEEFWLVDPLDGTKEFIKRNGEFTVNIALIDNNVPVAGVVYVPVTKTFYFARKDFGSYKFVDDGKVQAAKDIQEITASACRLPEGPEGRAFTVVTSRSHISKETMEYTNELRQKHGTVEVIACGSSLKLCMVAEGKADIYPRLGPTSEWDIAAAHAVVKEAGRGVYSYHSGEEFTYNKESLRNEWFIVS
ncbi:MAG: 3'(2'),5'-bisphosphate nucleotidase CysQ [Planctomycetes bacterium]|nr:3'(2'),5'-bisphosphate nucleotidase CysQ [Planctomycetota bacterium]